MVISWGEGLWGGCWVEAERDPHGMPEMFSVFA